MPETPREPTAASEAAQNMAKRLATNAHLQAVLRLAFLEGANWQLKRLLPNRETDHADHDGT